MIDLKENEKKVLGYWKENNINKKVSKKNIGKKKFFFLEGPPYASGEFAAHHIWVEVTKDAILRFQRYNERNVHDRAGFDVHGLPIEHKTEKEMKLESKQEIETKIGVSNFINECKAYAQRHVKNGVMAFERFGVSLDFENMYLAYNPEFMESAWNIFKKIYDSGLVYKDLEPLAYCTKCETVLAQGPEIEYEDETDPSIFVKFLLKRTNLDIDTRNTYLVIWTTTPWTLVSNMAIAAKSDAEYVVVSSEDENYIVAKDRLDNFTKACGKSIIVKSNFLGKELVGTTYENPLGEIPEIKNKFYKVVADNDFVGMDEGTGLVHVAPGHGPEDYKLAKKYKIPIFSPVDEHGLYTLKNYSGLKVPNEANKVILSKLKETGALLFSGHITHSYPHCWRCATKLIFRATDQWFINIQKLKKKMLKQNEKIEWFPEFARNWFNDAIETSPDWCISRQRYWGIPIPIWQCTSCNAIEVIGSKKELIERMIDKKDISDLHRPYVDEVKIKCAKCNSKMNRIQDIFDVWYDSGIAHTASLSEEEFKVYFPADWISESADQIRGWFSALLKTSIALYNKTPYKRVSIGGMIKDEIGREMHRHLGNSMTSTDLLQFASADGFRFWCLGHPRWQELKLKKQSIEKADSEIIMLYNIAQLIKEFNMLLGNNAENAKIKLKNPNFKSMEKADIWIVSRLNSIITKITKSMDSYAIHEAVKELREFIVEDFSRFYLKFAKQRASESRKNMRSVLGVSSYVLYNTLIISSIAIPFSCESIYQDLFAEKESIFLNKWPKPNAKLINSKVEEEFELLKDISSTILSLREKEHIKLKWPLQEAIVQTDNEDIIETIERVSNLISLYSNVKNIKIIKTALNKKTIKPIFNKLGPEFKQSAQTIANEIVKQDPNIIEQELETQGYYTLNTPVGHFNLNKEHIIIIEETALEEGAPFKHGFIKIDKNISKELEQEILIREIIRTVQVIRKELGLVKTDKINVHIKADNEVENAIKSDINDIKQKTNAKKADFEFNTEKVKLAKSIEVLNNVLEIGVE